MKIKILIPIYNDWNSVKLLINNIDKAVTDDSHTVLTVGKKPGILDDRIKEVKKLLKNEKNPFLAGSFGYHIYLRLRIPINPASRRSPKDRFGRFMDIFCSYRTYGSYYRRVEFCSTMVIYIV